MDTGSHVDQAGLELVNLFIEMRSHVAQVALKLALSMKMTLTSRCPRFYSLSAEEITGR